MTAFKAGPQRHPPLPVGGGKLAYADGARSRDHASDQPDRTAQHQRGRGRLAASGAALVVAVRAKQLLQRVVGARQIGHAIAVEQARAVAGRHLHEVVDGTSQRAGRIAPRGPSRQQALVADLHADRIEPGLVGKNMGGRTEPAMGTTDVRPEGSGALQTTLRQRADALQRLA